MTYKGSETIVHKINKQINTTLKSITYCVESNDKSSVVISLPKIINSIELPSIESNIDSPKYIVEFTISTTTGNGVDFSTEKYISTWRRFGENYLFFNMCHLNNYDYSLRPLNVSCNADNNEINIVIQHNYDIELVRYILDCEIKLIWFS